MTYPSGVQILRTFDEANRESLITWSAPGASGTVAVVESWFPIGGMRAH